MIQMIYKTKRELEILYEGTYHGRRFAILSLGSHPTAYIETFKDFRGQGYDVDLDVHGGVTYNDLSYWNKYEYLCLGWDYAHYGDYSGLDELYPWFDTEAKKWTTEEIFEEVKKAIDDLIILENKGD